MENRDSRDTLSVSITLEMRVAIYVEALKDAYCILRRHHKSDFKGLGAGYNEQIVPIAERLIRLNGCPYAYMQYVFDCMAATGGDVYVPMFCSEKMVDSFISGRVERERELDIIVYGQAEKVKARLRDGLTLDQILDDPDLPLSSVFCYALACSEQRHDLAVKFENGAKRMLIFEPHYKKLLGKWLPEKMKNV